MNCREALSLLPLFFDGELDAHQMRAVALHSTRCPECEGELRRLERVQELVDQHVAAALDDVDCSTLWPAIDRRIGTIRISWWSRLQAWWSDDDHRWAIRIPAMAAAAAIAVLAMLFFLRAPQPSTQPDASQVAMDNAASIDSLVTDVDAVTVLNDPETDTTVLWVSDDTDVPGDAP